MKTPLPPVLRAALYRRAVACAWLTLCERQHRYPHLTLDALEAPSPPSWRLYLRQHGEEKRPPDCLCAAGRFDAGRAAESRPVAVLPQARRDG